MADMWSRLTTVRESFVRLLLFECSQAHVSTYTWVWPIKPPADAARQHAHIDTNRAYTNETTRDQTYSSLIQS